MSRVTPPGAIRPAEVSVAINPTNPDNLVAVSLQARTPTTDFAYVSFDGGSSWTSVPGPNPERRTQGDDAIVFDSEGTAYWSYISFAGLRQKRPKSAANGIFVNRSDNGGRSWSEPVAVVDHENTVAPFEDKPFVAVGAGGEILLAWTRFTEYGSDDPVDTSHIYFSLSEDGGRSFSMPIRVSDQPGDAIDSDGTLEGVVPAVGLDGEIYLVWSGGNQLVFDRSTDGGRTFGVDRKIAAHSGGWDTDVEGISRSNGMPVTDVDASDGAFRGSLYVNWADDRHGDLDVFVMASRDRGETFDEPVRVNRDPIGNGAEQFFTWMAVDPIDGSVNVAFYDRADLRGSLTGVTLARSTDGGRTFESYPVSIEPFGTSPGVFFGDYLGIDAYGGRTVAVFTHFIEGDELAISAALFRFQ